MKTATFDIDEFLVLLLRQEAGQTTRRENKYIRWALKHQQGARQVLDDVRESFPHETFNPKGRRYVNTILKVLVSVMLVCACGYLYSMLAGNQQNTLDTSITEDSVFRFERSPLKELIPVIEKQYGVSVVLDNPRLSQMHYTGSLSWGTSIATLLDDLHQMNGVTHYYDEKGRLHLSLP